MAEAAPNTPRKSFPLKTLLILVGVLLLEGLAVSAAFLLAGKPAQVEADPNAPDAQALANQPVEELVVSEKFQNSRTGRTYLYDTEIYILVKRKHQSQVQTKLQDMTARLTTEIATIFRSAEPAQLDEPTLATVTRQVQAKLDELLGKDVETGESVVDKVLVRKCIKFRADY